MRETKTVNLSFSEGKLKYQSPEVEVYNLHTPLRLLEESSESIIAADGETENFTDGEDFY